MNIHEKCKVYTVHVSVSQKMSFTVVCQKNSQKMHFNSELTVFSEKVLHVHQTKNP